MSVLLDWLHQGGPSAPKHRTWRHAIVVCTLHYLVVTMAALAAHDLLLHSVYDSVDLWHCPWHATRPHLERPSSSIPVVVLIYALWLLLWRLRHAAPLPNTIFYEYTWLCNVTLLLGSLSIYILRRPLLATALCVAVSIDQVLWYVDIVGYFFSSTFPIGVCKYVFWPGTSWATRVTCTHHLWTIPILLYASGGLHALAFPLSIFLVCINVLLSRLWTPHHVAYSASNKDSDSMTTTTYKYLNVNLSHELWKDIRISFLQIGRDNPRTALYLFRLLWRWQLFNFIVFLGLYLLSQSLLGTAPLCV